MHLLKQILFQAPSRPCLDSFLAALAAVPGVSVEPEADPPRFLHHDLQVRVLLAESATGALQRLSHDYLNLFVLDLRETEDGPGRLEAHLAEANALFDALDAQPSEERYGFHRVLALVGGEGDRTDQLIASLAARGIGRVLRQPPGDGVAFGKLLLAELRRMMLDRAPGRSALCLAGGGVTGIFFELGALKCLDDCLPAGALNSFDYTFGISAGAIVGGMLANGWSVDEIMAAVAGHPGGRLPPIDLNVFRWAHLDLEGIGRRAQRLLRSLGRVALSLARSGSPGSGIELLGNPSSWVAPLFRTDRFEHRLRELFGAPGATNDFRKLPRRLFVGATDQDTRTHVLFGDDRWNDIPISQAIGGSMAINPAFVSVPIEGRYYTDGAVTRTSNFVEAVAKGADLIVVVDPFLPYSSKKPGFSRDRGLLYNLDQDVRALSYTRFEKTRNLLLRRHPGVSMYTFLPANHLRRLLSVNPMDHRAWPEIWRGAYLSTLRRVMHLRHRLRGDFSVHGFTLDTARAEAVARRLEAVPEPDLADFYPDRRVELRRPPLAREAPAPAEVRARPEGQAELG